MSKPIYYVYHYLRPKDSETAKAGTPYYVGKGSGNRAYGKHQKGIKVPEDRNMIVIVENYMYEEDAFTLEISDIKEHGRKDLGTGILHNRTDGGEGFSGLIMTQNHRANLKIALTGRKLSPTHIKNSADGNRGKKRTQETKDRIGNGNRGKKRTQESNLRNANSKRGSTHTQETKDRIGDFQRGRKKSPDAVKKTADFNRGKNLSPEHIAKLSASHTGQRWHHNPETGQQRQFRLDCVPDGFILGMKKKKKLGSG